MSSPKSLFSFLSGNVLILTISGALGMFSRSLVFPYAPLYILSLGGDPSEVGLVYALGPLGGLVMYPIAGYLADHVDRAKLIALTGYVSALVVLIYVVAPNWKWVAFARMLQGIGAVQTPAQSSIIADSLDPSNRGRGNATMTTVAGTVALIAPYIAGVLLDAYGIDVGMRILYGAMAAAGGIASTINLLFIRETREIPGQKITAAGLAQALKDSYSGIPSLLRRFSYPLRAMSTISILAYIVNGIASPFWVIRAETHIGLTRRAWGLVLMIEQGLRSLIGIPAGFCVDRFGRTKFILGGLLAYSVLVPLFLYAQTFSNVVLVRCAIVLVGSFFSPACSALVADLMPRDIRGRAMALVGRGSVRMAAASGGTGGPGVGLLTILPLMLASYSGGVLYELDSTWPWMIVPGITMAGFLLAAVFVRDPEVAEV